MGDPMRYALMTEPQQGLTYEEILALARAAEEAGFESYFRSDHYAELSRATPACRPRTPGRRSPAWLARPARIGLGVLVSPVTFRLPGNLAKVVTTVDEMSGGRVEVGLGAGWNELEHAQHGMPFPEQGERFEMLEEQLAIVHGLWTEPDGWSYEGRHWQVRDARFCAKAGGARGPTPSQHHRRRQRWPAHVGARRTLRGRDEHQLRVTGSASARRTSACDAACRRSVATRPR